MYTGSKISIELLNTRFLLKRELLQRFVEESLFKPIAEENGYYEEDEEGNRTWFYPKLSFSRLTIRDNAEVFDSLFQLYQKGSIPVGTILDLFNLDEDEIDDKLKQDMFTPKDATYNDMLRGIYSYIGEKVANDTDLVKQIIGTIKGPLGKKLKYTPQEEDNGGYEGDNSFEDDWNDDYTTQDNLDDFTDENDDSDVQTDENQKEEEKLREYLEYVEDKAEESNSTSVSENSSNSDSSSNTMSNEEAQEIINKVVDKDDLQKDLKNLQNNPSFKLN